MFVAVKLVGVSALFALVLTLLASPLLLLAYRRRVSQGMAQAAGAGLVDPPLGPASAPRWRRVTLARGEAVSSIAPRDRRVILAYAAGGFAHALFMTLAFGIAYYELASFTVMVAALAVFLLPAAATALWLAVPAPTKRALAFGALLLVVFVLLGIARDLGQTLFEAFVLLPAVLLFVFSLRFWRGVAPLVLPVVGIASLLWVLGAEIASQFSLGDALRWVLRIGGFTLGLVLGVLALRMLERRHEAQQLGDRQLFIDAWWLVYTIYLAVVFAIMRGQLGWFALLAAFPLYLLVRSGLRPDPDATPPRRLLLLRVFDQGRRTEKLFERLEAQWRGIGSVQLIAGRDLALRNIGPADFVAFVSGRLAQRFVTRPEALQQRLAAAPARRDPDGRFGVEHFWCRADTWRAVMRTLAARADLVLMDLRGFDADRAGCAYELQHLAASARDKRVLLLVSEEAEAQAVQALVAAREDPGAPWQLVRVDPGAVDLGSLLR